jgi:hypothetical protein
MMSCIFTQQFIEKGSNSKKMNDKCHENAVGMQAQPVLCASDSTQWNGMLNIGGMTVIC